MLPKGSQATGPTWDVPAMASLACRLNSHVSSRRSSLEAAEKDYRLSHELWLENILANLHGYNHPCLTHI
ncbi:unnamed protein product [Protopolystoma xenopodis]|uniref:Uncharacterized protein n=1 Tax=Protopolystoma xenopodis TaxID=117903 RepID=A0A3S5AE09_9PLAT|nr:unnamed protein product [Protopolystoma xenopodis]